jgi:ribosome biogenesis GTPase
LHEPGCGVLNAVQDKTAGIEISPTRYKIYGDLFAELSQTRY